MVDGSPGRSLSLNSAMVDLPKRIIKVGGFGLDDALIAALAPIVRAGDREDTAGSRSGD